MQVNHSFEGEALQKRGPYKNNRRQEVIDVAIGLFSYYGYDGVTYKMLNKETGISEGAIHKLFGGKENLGRLCAQQVTDAFKADIRKLNKLNLEYQAYVKELSEIFKCHKDDFRFILSLTAIPNNSHILDTARVNNAGLWEDLFRGDELQTELQTEPNDTIDVIFVIAILDEFYISVIDKNRHKTTHKSIISKLMKL